MLQLKRKRIPDLAGLQILGQPGKQNIIRDKALVGSNDEALVVNVPRIPSEVNSKDRLVLL